MSPSAQLKGAASAGREFARVPGAAPSGRPRPPSVRPAGRRIKGRARLSPCGHVPPAATPAAFPRPCQAASSAESSVTNLGTRPRRSTPRAEPGRREARGRTPPQVAELRTKLDAAEGRLGAPDGERQRRQHQRPRDGDGPRGPARNPPREEKEKESLNEELHELKKENKLLKEKNALAKKKKEHLECEIRYLNKALQDALSIECSLSSGDCLWKSGERCLQELRTEMEVLKQQVQIYEEDFKKERSDRERLNQEKEELQQINQTFQSQLNRLNSQIKACQMEKEKLEKQLKQMCLPTCHCGWFSTCGIPGDRKVLRLCRIHRSTHQTARGTLRTGFRQTHSTRPTRRMKVPECKRRQTVIPVGHAESSCLYRHLLILDILRHLRFHGNPVSMSLAASSIPHAFVQITKQWSL
ncbi:LOW QUALITY PROTEIN: TNFAIP3-interacting protein 1-like [Lemur catta]|uniref:LOW QUALITY PROTEIN: TNFAIP3-interacting protein 1-like n=1 Tax=Lemur catta TaxID=9447 RepID=UPI001E268855|nr:LOW QUALITY PROTEIN: TNFAIP3-interacting protein 1-like [Lemur catta]